jgi:hypothetical protein
MEIRFNFKYSDSAIAAHFKKTGENLNRDAFVIYDGKSLSEEARSASLVINADFLNVHIPPSLSAGFFDSAPTVEEVQVRILEEAVKIIGSRKADAEKLRADTISQTAIVEDFESLSAEALPDAIKLAELKSWNCVKSLRDRLKVLESRSDEIVKARELAAKEAIKADRLAWIKNHGSDHLKKAIAAGYNCQRKYVEERSAFEFTEFDLDFDDQLKHRSRSCPSLDALAWLDRFPQGQIIWVEKRHDHSDDDEDYEDELNYEGEEAIVIENYLGKYGLVKYLG